MKKPPLTKKKSHALQVGDLRARAEEKVKKKTTRASNKTTQLSPADAEWLIQELQVHQVELEMQNDELCCARTELEDSRARYFELYDLAPVGYLTLNAKGLILEANLTAATMLGVARSALDKKFLSQCILPEDRDIYYRHRKQLMETDAPQVCEMRMVKKDGTLVWVRMESVAAKAADGTAVIRSVLSDITEHRHAEKVQWESAALRESEEKVRRLSAEQDAILNNIGSSVFYLKNREVQWANRSAASLFGYSVGELTGKETSLLCPDRGCYEQLGREAYPLLAKGKTYSVDRQMKKKSGELIWCRIVVQPVKPVDPEEGVIWLVDDITERKQSEDALTRYRVQLETMVKDRTMDLDTIIEKLKTEVNDRKHAEDALRRNNVFLHGIFEGIQDGIAVIDTNQNIIMVNRAVEAFFRSEGAVGFKTKKCFELFQQSAKRCDNCVASKAIEEKTTQVDTIRFKTDGAGAGLFERFTFPLRDEQGEVKGVIQYLRDITEKHLLEERARRNDHLAALGQISAGIAHEINNPNNIIMGNSELLMDVWHDADSVLSAYSAERGDFLLGRLPFSEMRLKVNTMISRILNGSIRINAIVTGMKQYTSHMHQGHTEKVTINDVVRDCIETLSDQIGKTTDVFRLDLDENIPVVAGNRQALEEVTTNLVSNALQSLKDRTKGVSVTTRHDRNGNSVVLAIRDEGTGMTSEVLRQAGNPFFTTRQNSGGMGLGLSIVHSIMKNHHGSLDFESRPGQGTVATVRLPVRHD